MIDRLVPRMPPSFDFDSVKTSPGYWYFATPYTRYRRGIFHAFRHASIGAAGLIRLGVSVLSPIAHTHPVGVYGGIDPYDIDFWLKADGALMNAATGLIVFQLEGWRDSKGVTHEIETFDRDGKPIEYLAPWELRDLLKAWREAYLLKAWREAYGRQHGVAADAFVGEIRG